MIAIPATPEIVAAGNPLATVVIFVLFGALVLISKLVAAYQEQQQRRKLQEDLRHRQEERKRHAGAAPPQPHPPARHLLPHDVPHPGPTGHMVKKAPYHTGKMPYHAGPASHPAPMAPQAPPDQLQPDRIMQHIERPDHGLPALVPLPQADEIDRREEQLDARRLRRRTRVRAPEPAETPAAGPGAKVPHMPGEIGSGDAHRHGHGWHIRHIRHVKIDLHDQHSARAAIILHELLGPPKALGGGPAMWDE